MSKISSGSLTVVDVKGGSDGINTATIYLYQRAVGAPDKPQNNLTYTFATAELTGNLGNWTQSIGTLTGNNPIWVIAAVASSNGEEDIILPEEWSGPIQMAQDGQDGQDGQPGAPGAPGLNQATVFIYKRASSVTKPSNSTYTFATGDFTVDGNWEKTIPAATTENKNPCWVCSAVAIGSGNEAELVWSNPSLLVENGSNGLSPTVTQLTNGVKIVDAEGNETFVTNGSNGQSYYTHVRYSENANGSNYVSTPTSDTIYVGIYSGLESIAPPYDNSGWTWSRYVGTDGIDGDDGVSVTGTRELYYLKTNSENVPSITSTSQIDSISKENGWTSVVPTYVTNGIYYTCIETSLSTGGPVWSAPVENKGLTDSNKNAYDAATDASEAKELSRATQQHFWFNAISDTLESGAYITDTAIDTFKNGKNGGYVLIRSDGLLFGNGVNRYMELSGSELKFYKAGTTDSTASITSNVAAKLSSTGLEIANGSITLGNYFSVDNTGVLTAKSGTIGGWNFTDAALYYSNATPGYSTTNLVVSKSSAVNTNAIADSETNKHWFLAAGRKFGVDTEGNLYANNAHLSSATVEGAITATSLTISSGGTTYSGISAINISGYSIEIITDSTGVTDADITTYLYPHLYHNGIEIEYLLSADTIVDSSKTYYTRSGTSSDYTYTVVTNPSGNPNTNQYYEHIDYSKFLWFKDNETIGTAGDANNQGRYLATYGHSYRVIYDFEDGEVSGATEIQTREVDPQKYITRIADNGITVHPEIMAANSNYIHIDGNSLMVKRQIGMAAAVNTDIVLASFGTTVQIGQNGVNNVFIDDESVDIRAGKDVKASFGNPTIIGDATASHADISPYSFSIYNGVPTKCFSIESSGSTMPVPVETPYTDTLGLQILPSESTKSQTYNTSEHFIPTTAETLSIMVTYGDIKNSYGITSVGSVLGGMPILFQDSSGTILFRGYVDSRWTANTQTLSIQSITQTVGTRSDTLKFEVKSYNEIIEESAPAMLYGQLAEDGSIGAYSFAEGYSVSASGDYSHAEGYQTVASGIMCAHAEGYKTVSSGNGSHTEGAFTIASTGTAHAEGSHTIAQGAGSHAQNTYTVATEESQTVIGKYNKATVSGNGTSNNPYVYSDVGDYAFIIGNGSSNSTANRSNALTVDWSGNTTIAGTLTQSSDRRLKTHQSYLSTDAINFIQNLKPVHFIKDGAHHVGFYAQDVESIDPWDCMIGEMNGYKTLGYTEIIAPLVTYCQHLEERIKQLEEK